MDQNDDDGGVEPRGLEIAWKNDRSSPRLMIGARGLTDRLLQFIVLDMTLAARQIASIIR